MKTVSSPQVFEREFPELARSERGQIIRKYLEMGGVVRIEGDRVVYPTKKRVREKIREKKEILRKIEEELRPRKLRKKNKYLPPVYWRHRIRMALDGSYREAVRKAGIKEDLLETEEGERIVRAFMENPEYRERVIQTVEESVVYKNREFGESIRRKYGEKRVSLREKVLMEKRERISREIGILEELLKVLP